MKNTLIWLQEMEDNNENWVNISSVITMLKKEQEQAINYTRCCEEFKCGEERVNGEVRCKQQCEQCKQDYSDDI